jgi:opacity protein-like surface antigen
VPFSSRALAEDLEPIVVYLGAGVGPTKARNLTPSSPCAKLAGLSSADSCSVVDDSDIGWKVFGGVQVTPYFALEGSLVDLGKLRLSGTATINVAPFPSIPVSISSDRRAYGFGVDGVFTIPISREFSLLARVGLLFWNVQSSTIRTTAGGNPFGLDKKVTGSSLDFGAGAQYDLTERAGIRVEYQRYKGVGDEGTTGKTDVDLISANFVYRFR